MIVALGCDHAGFPFKARVAREIEAGGHVVLDVGAFEADPDDDYPVFARRVGEAVRDGRAERGVLLCGSGVGVSIAANKLPGIKAALCHDTYSAHQGVEHDHQNVLCLGMRVVGAELAAELVRAFLAASFSGAERHVRRLAEVDAIEGERESGALSLDATPLPPSPRYAGGGGHQLEVFPDADALASAAAGRIVTLAREATVARGRFSIALSGGATPGPVYRLLAQDPLAVRIDWSRVHVFWADERCVDPDHPASNYRMAREALLDHVPLRIGNVHRIHGEDEPESAAREYERLLRTFFDFADLGPPPRSFDLALLGLGEDGHTASLFPGTPPVVEIERWVMANVAEHAAVPRRVTLTPVVLAASRDVVFLVAGSSKAGRLREALEGPSSGSTPARLVRPRRGALHWMVDEAAAGRSRAAA
jgi:6-phosphogluconolactonase